MIHVFSFTFLIDQLPLNEFYYFFIFFRIVVVDVDVVVVVADVEVGFVVVEVAYLEMYFFNFLEILLYSIFHSIDSYLSIVSFLVISMPS
jgi:hypothetical protein